VYAAWPNCPSQAAVDLEPRLSLVDEVELVLGVVVVVRALVLGREDDRVDAKGVDAERLPDLAEAVAVTEGVERVHGVAHGRIL